MAGECAHSPYLAPAPRHRLAPRDARGSPDAGLAVGGRRCAEPEIRRLRHRALQSRRSRAYNALCIAQGGSPNHATAPDPLHRRTRRTYAGLICLSVISFGSPDHKYPLCEVIERSTASRHGPPSEVRELREEASHNRYLAGKLKLEMVHLQCFRSAKDSRYSAEGIAVYPIESQQAPSDPSGQRESEPSRGRCSRRSLTRRPRARDHAGDAVHEGGSRCHQAKRATTCPATRGTG